MSMIGAQIDELRKLADGQATYRDARAVMLQAADTIWQLRDDLQRANSENDRLIQAIEDLHNVSLEDRLVQLENDNDKLRELARFIMHQCNDGNQRCGECIGWNDGECVALLRMRELGVEVDDG